jgi:hypothetical protein
MDRFNIALKKIPEKSTLSQKVVVQTKNDVKDTPERRAVREASLLEKKALECISIAQKMFPKAPDDVIESQAVDLMSLPNQAIANTLSRYTDEDKNNTERIKS